MMLALMFLITAMRIAAYLLSALIDLQGMLGGKTLV